MLPKKTQASSPSKSRSPRKHEKRRIVKASPEYDQDSDSDDADDSDVELSEGGESVLPPRSHKGLKVSTRSRSSSGASPSKRSKNQPAATALSPRAKVASSPRGKVASSPRVTAKVRLHFFFF